MRSLNKFGLLSCLSVLLAGRSARADEVVITPDLDNTIIQNTMLSNGAGPDCFTGATLIGVIHRTLMRFDVAAALPAGSTIQSVSLTLYCSRTISGPVPQNLFRVVAAWGEGASVGGGSGGGQGAPATEGDATWFHRFYPDIDWATAGGDVVAQSSGAAIAMEEGTLCTFASTAQMVADAQAWLNNPDSNFGWMIKGDETATTTTKRFAAREGAVPGQRPRLTITFTPPAPVPGDLNGDGVVNEADRAIFVEVLLGLDSDPLHVARSDLNLDGQPDGDDIPPFVAAIIP